MWRGLHCTGAQACHRSGFTLRHSEQLPVTRLQPVRILAGPSGFPLCGGRCGRLNEVLDAGSGIPGLRLQQPESSSRGFLSCSLTHSFFRAAGGGGFRKSLGRPGSDPVDTCPGSTAAGPGFDSWGGGPRGRFLPCVFLGREAGGAGRSAPLPLCTTPPLFKAKLRAVLFLFGPAPTLEASRCSPMLSEESLRRLGGTSRALSSQSQQRSAAGAPGTEFLREFL